MGNKSLHTSSTREGQIAPADLPTTWNPRVTCGGLGWKCETLYDLRFRSWNFLLEKHSSTCPCSHCRPYRRPEFKKDWGLALPQCKAANSWRIVFWTWKTSRFYARWTLPKWMCRREARSVPKAPKSDGATGVSAEGEAVVLTQTK